MSKALRKQGAEVLSEKKYPLPVNGCHPRPLPQKRFAFCRVSIADQIALPLSVCNK